MKRTVYVLVAVWLLICVGHAEKPMERKPPVADAKLVELGLDRDYHLCTAVADGDTLTLEKIGTVRLLGVDTPEKKRAGLPAQFLAEEARAFTTSLCLGKKIRLDYDPYDPDLRDRYSRVLGWAYLEDGTWVQERLVREGYSIAYLKFPFDPDKRAQLVAWEKEARERGLGLWRENGMAEVRYLFADGQPAVQVFGMAYRKWGLRYGKYVLPHIEPGKLESRLNDLLAAIAESHTKDLDTLLKSKGYQIDDKVLDK